MEASRRDFLGVTLGGLGAIGALGALYPIVKTLEPSAASSMEGRVEMKLSEVPELGVRVTSWRGKPLFIVHLPEDIEQRFQYPSLKAGAKNSAGKTNKEIIGSHRIFALEGVCTHLGCIPLWKPEGSDAVKAPYFHCPCHGGLYTPWGDVIGGPPPRPLYVPPQKIEGDKLIVDMAIKDGFVKERV